jgi:hypothetical protein
MFPFQDELYNHIVKDAHTSEEEGDIAQEREKEEIIAEVWRSAKNAMRNGVTKAEVIRQINEAYE